MYLQGQILTKQEYVTWWITQVGETKAEIWKKGEDKSSWLGTPEEKEGWSARREKFVPV